MRKDPVVVNILGKIKELSKIRKTNVFLVGGFIRDMLLDNNSFDVDLAVEKDCEGFSRALSKRLSAKHFLLDSDTQTYRITYKIKGKNQIWNIDLCKMYGKNIISDLGRRDFTIDAIAMNVEKLTSGQVDKWTSRQGNKGTSRQVDKLTSKQVNKLIRENLVDPFNGVADLKKKTIKMVSKECFKEDPLRCLRAFRLSASTGFKIDPKTFKEISKNAPLIKKVSRERVREEMFKILEAKNSTEYLEKLYVCGLLKNIFVQTKFLEQEKGLWKHSVLTVKFVEYLLDDKNLKNIWVPSLAKQAIKEVTAQPYGAALLKFLCLFHDIGKPFTKKKKKNKLTFIAHESVGSNILEEIAINLRLSNKQTKFLKLLAKNHMRGHYLVNLKVITKRAEARFIRDIDENVPMLLLFTVADFLATAKELKRLSFSQNKQATKKLLNAYFKFKNIKEYIKLVNGHDIIKEFKMQQGPAIGRILGELDLAQREGKIKTREQAMELASKIVKRSK